jgi:hypothetical protein
LSVNATHFSGQVFSEIMKNKGKAGRSAVGGRAEHRVALLECFKIVGNILPEGEQLGALFISG